MCCSLAAGGAAAGGGGGVADMHDEPRPQPGQARDCSGAVI